MNIHVKPRARTQLAKHLPPESGIRLHIANEGRNCGCTLVFDLSFEHHSQTNDRIINTNICPIYIDETSVNFLTQDLKFDYIQNVGYSLSSDQETLAYGLTISRSQSQIYHS